MDEYRIVLESQLGPREGILKLECQNGILKGTINLLGYENPVSGEWTGENSMRLLHNLHTKISDICCISVFEINGDTITGTLRSGRNVMKWHGEKEAGKKGGSIENGRE